MYCFGDCRSATFSRSPRAIRSRSRARIFSRSIATDFMRLPSVSVDKSGMASVITVATAASAANSAVRCLVLCSQSMRSDTIGPRSEVEVDHFFHDHHADGHPHGAAGHHDAAEIAGPKQLDVVRAG